MQTMQTILGGTAAHTELLATEAKLPFITAQWLCYRHFLCLQSVMMLGPQLVWGSCSMELLAPSEFLSVGRAIYLQCLLMPIPVMPYNYKLSSAQIFELMKVVYLQLRCWAWFILGYFFYFYWVIYKTNHAGKRWKVFFSPFFICICLTVCLTDYTDPGE